MKRFFFCLELRVCDVSKFSKEECPSTRRVETTEQTVQNWSTSVGTRDQTKCERFANAKGKGKIEKKRRFVRSSFLGRVAEKKHQRSLKRLNVVSKANRANQAIQLRKQKLLSKQQTRQTIGSTDGVHQIIVRRASSPPSSPPRPFL